MPWQVVERTLPPPRKQFAGTRWPCILVGSSHPPPVHIASSDSIIAEVRPRGQRRRLRSTGSWEAKVKIT
ncbi:hypothetical protein CBOM_07885 [Ceraceosorus bombacis]|uniref:Uncharacterized protein n=1 Tax=Ceraceosorus bombacis TaxID=401625 RepID=A0A0P1BI05_9BASI|nr:hypothetical protein CBOM_07885 [Ceraceosorus bombacis]